VKKIIHDGWGAVCEIFERLVGAPESVRAFVQTECGILIVGAGARGFVFPRARLDGVSNVIVLNAGDGVGDTFLHETAHAIAGHRSGGMEAEREAALLAASWGATGESADADSCASAFLWASAREAAPNLRARVAGDAVQVECAECGDPCRVLAPTAATLPAFVGAECARCPGFAVLSLADLVPCACGARPTVTWVAGSTPKRPIATWQCDCGASSTRELLIAPPDAEPLPPPNPELEYATSLLMQAMSLLLRIEETLRRLESGVFEPMSIAFEGCRASLWQARRLTRRAVRELPPCDARRSVIDAALSELASAGHAFVERDLSATADSVARATRCLDSMLAQAATPEARKS
jgi:hypothetical protein